MQVFYVPMGRTAGFAGSGPIDLRGATAQSTATQAPPLPNDLFGTVIGRFSDAEVRLRQARAQVLAAYNAGVSARVPLDTLGLVQLTDAYNALRRKLAQDLVRFVEYVTDTIEAAQGLLGSWGTTPIRQRVGDANAWGDALLTRAPAIRASELTGVNFGNPALVAAAIPLAQGLLAIVGIGVAGYFISGAIRAFNDTATAADAEAERIRALAEGKLAIIDAMRRAGATPQQIADELTRQADLNKPPDAGGGFGTVLLAALGVAALGVAGWAYTRRPRRR